MLFERFDRWSVCVLSVLAGLVLTPAGGAHAQPQPLSGEFQINVYTVDGQGTPAIAADSQGGFVVAWEQADPMGIPVDVSARRFDSSGNPLGDDFLVHEFTQNAQRSPAVGRSAAGGFVVVWSSSGQDGDLEGIFARRFDSAGNPLAAEFQVNTYTTGGQTFPKLAMRAGGEFVVVWSSGVQDANTPGIFGQRFDAAGGRVGVEFEVNDYGTGDQLVPAVFLRPDASFIVTWNSNGQDGNLFGAFGRRFDSSGTAVGGDFQINAYTTNNQINPSLAVDSSGGFVAAWSSLQGGFHDVIARRFSSTATPLASEFIVNTYTPEDQTLPVILATGGGSFVVVWNSELQDGDFYGVFARELSSQGQPRGGEVQVNTTTVNTQRAPRAVATGQRLVVTWGSGAQDGDSLGIFARRFLIALTLDVDGNGLVDPLTDSLMILRYTFGFRGATLISGAVGPGCTRCDAPSIEAYIEQM
jgi:hypothetical protein